MRGWAPPRPSSPSGLAPSEGAPSTAALAAWRNVGRRCARLDAAVGGPVADVANPTGELQAWWWSNVIVIDRAAGCP